MRANRAHLASFGTAGALVAGAAVLFALAAGVIAFHGWPSSAPDLSPAAVAIVPPGTHRATPASAGVIAAVTSLGGGDGGRAGTGARPSSPRPPAGSGVPRTGAGLVHVGSVSSSGCGSACGNGTGASTTAGGSLTSSLGAVITGAGDKVGTVVSSTGAKLGAAVGHVSARAGKALAGAGRTAGAVAKGAGAAAGKILSGLGKRPKQRRLSGSF